MAANDMRTRASLNTLPTRVVASDERPLSGGKIEVLISYRFAISIPIIKPTAPATPMKRQGFSWTYS